MTRDHTTRWSRFVQRFFMLPVAYVTAFILDRVAGLGKLARVILINGTCRFVGRRLLVILFLAVLVLGTWGFWQAEGNKGFWDALYRTVQMFGLTFAMPSDPSAEVPLILDVARFGAALVSVGTVLFLVLAKMGREFRVWTQAMLFGERRVVLLGFGQVNRALARVLIDRGSPVTIVAGEITDSHREMAARMGCAIRIGDLFETETMRAVFLTQCSKVIVACGDDEINVEIATAASSLMQQRKAASKFRQAVRNIREGVDPSTPRLDEPIVHVHISDVGMLLDLEDANDVAYSGVTNMNGFSIKVDMARDFVNRARLPIRARELGQDQVHLVIVGFGDLGHAILNETLTTSFSKQTEAPVKITIIDKNADALGQQFMAVRPTLFDPQIRSLVEIEFKQFEIDECAFDQGGRNPDLPCYGVTAWVFACGDDTINLKAGVRLEMAMLRGRWPFSQIFVKLWSANIAPEHALARNPLLITQIFGNITDTARHDEVVNPGYEDLAIALHREYKALNAKNYADSWNPERRARVADGYRDEWRHLPMNMKESNRRLARSIRTKLMDAGYQWRHMSKAGLPSFTDLQRTAMREKLQSFERWARKETAEEDPAASDIAAVYRVEHDRWMVDRALSGWRASPDGKTIKTDRLHRNMLPLKDIQRTDLLYDLLPEFLIANSDEEGQTRVSVFDPNRPAHKLKSVDARLSPLGGWHGPDDLESATEIVLQIEGSQLNQEPVYAIDERTAAQALSDLGAWSKRPQACRIHVIGDRLTLDQLSGGQHPLLAVGIGSFVRRLKAAVDDGITIDATYMSCAPKNAPLSRRFKAFGYLLDEVNGEQNSIEMAKIERLRAFAKKMKSGCGIRIAVSGHRWNKLDPTDGMLTRLALRDAFALIAREVSGQVTLATGMAEGADLIAVDEMPGEWRLEAVLAMSVGEWESHLSSQAANLQSPDARLRKIQLGYDIEVFRQSLRHPRRSIVVTSRPHDYVEVGARVLANSDLLIAIWDGQAGQPGGTGSVVANSIQRGVAILHVNPFEKA